MCRYEIERIDCVHCHKLIYIEYFNIHTEEYDEDVYCSSVFYNMELYCTDCIIQCEKCGCDILKNKSCNDYCNDCFIKNLIKTTCNDITRKLPIEIVDLILKM
jgi:hypothetical protein